MFLMKNWLKNSKIALKMQSMLFIGPQNAKNEGKIYLISLHFFHVGTVAKNAAVRYRVNQNFLENLLNDCSSLTIQYYLILRPFSEFLTSKPKGESLFFNCVEEKKGKIPLSLGTRTAATSQPFSPLRQSRLSFEKGSLFMLPLK